MNTQTDMTEKIAMAQADIDGIQAQIDFARAQLEHYTVARWKAACDFG
jgi:hypothetical protein